MKNANYRSSIIKGLANLQLLDDLPVTVEERFKSVGKFPQHLVQYAANMKHFRAKKQIEKELAEEKKPLYLGKMVEEREGLNQVR